MKTLHFLLILAVVSTLFGCGQIKHIQKGSRVYHYVDNKDARDTDVTAYDKLEVYRLRSVISSEIEDKTDYQIVKNDTLLKSLKPDTIIIVKPPIAAKVDLGGVFYTNESKIKTGIKSYNDSFIYGDTKFGLQALTIPLKFRGSVGDGVLNPATVETGINIGFAPGVKFTRNVFNPASKIMGKNLNQYSITTGLLLNLGATDLKKVSNAPGILSDRKGVTLTYGTYVMFGINNINFGYAVGFDKLTGNKDAQWVYNGKLWHGVIVSLDVLKF
ncbi:hypothetical protein MUGA111182_11540 [Mucilaginibacter galii]|uniref:hypothetical protein n=1 Tax=Mucilaginibacter galii TaxID=2005073 RepID=UPI00166C0A90|nr:hypothetical protein [Mucilaginibacter galii]